METTIVYWVYIGIMENKMETTIVYYMLTYIYIHMSDYGPFLGILNCRCRILIGNQRGTIIFTDIALLTWYLKGQGDLVSMLTLVIPIF